MPYVEHGGVRLHYVLEGMADAPWLILSNSLGTRLDMWMPQLSGLSERFRVLRYDTRGHGESSTPAGPYTMAELGEDVIALMDALKIARAHFCGLSMGGMTGLWLGIHRPERLDRLVLSNASARAGTVQGWNERIGKVAAEGMESIAPAVLERWFTPAYRQRAPQDVESIRAMLLRTPVQGYIANCAAVRDMDLRDAVASVPVPTLVIGGAHDTSVPPQDSRWIAGRIPGARYLELDSAHLSNWEQSEAFTAALTGFLSEAG